MTTQNLNKKQTIALTNIIRWIKKQYSPIAIIASGSIIRGNPDSSSDFDMYVIIQKKTRQRVQRFSNGIPCEIFVTNKTQIREYLKSEYRENRPITAHMISSGIVVYEKNKTYIRTIKEAKSWLHRKPEFIKKHAIAIKHTAALDLEDAKDTIIRAPETANLKISKAIENLIRYYFYSKRLHLPRPKDMFSALKTRDKSLFNYASKAMLSKSIKERYKNAERLSMRIIKTKGFFEWKSDIEKTK